jgi:hypothetical protein
VADKRVIGSTPSDEQQDEPGSTAMIHFRTFARAAFAVAAIAAVAAGAAPAAAQSRDGLDRRVSIENRSGQTIVYVRGSPTTASSFGEDRIPDRVLAHRQNVMVNFDDGSRACMWDLRATLADGRHVDRMNVNVCRISRWTIDRRNNSLN